MAQSNHKETLRHSDSPFLLTKPNGPKKGVLEFCENCFQWHEKGTHKVIEEQKKRGKHE